MTELDKLMRIKDPAVRIKVHYARAEVFMDQENFKEGLDEIESVLLRQPNIASMRRPCCARCWTFTGRELSRRIRPTSNMACMTVE